VILNYGSPSFLVSRVIGHDKGKWREGTEVDERRKSERRGGKVRGGEEK
jgi:hypothetical protein